MGRGRRSTGGRRATPKQVGALRHEEAKRSNIPTAEQQSIMQRESEDPLRVPYERRNRDLDPQLVWRGKDEQDWSDLVVPAPPLFIQEKVHPKVLVDDLLRRSEKTEEARARESEGFQFDLFSDFNGVPEGDAKTEFYQHEANWTNRMILGDSLQVMASLTEREGLKGKVQCIYIDPPYGIKFNSNFQWSTTSRDVRDGNAGHITREPEQVKAFRDTWRDGIHSYLTYLRDRLSVARELLTDSGSVFVQMGDENVHRVRALMDEVFGETNFVSQISFATTSGQSTNFLPNTNDYVLMYAKDRPRLKFRSLLGEKAAGGERAGKYRSIELDVATSRPATQVELEGDGLPEHARVFTLGDLVSNGWSESGSQPYAFRGTRYICPSNSHWKTTTSGLDRLGRSERLVPTGRRVMFKRYLDDFGAYPLTNAWTDTSSGFSLADPKVYVVQTRTLVVERCLLMASDPGDLVLDPTCGAGTTAYAAEQRGRRWITIDTSRVALALARARVMGARYPYYLLADSAAGHAKEAEITRTEPSSKPAYGDVRHGFVYERLPHIQLRDIANNAEIDVIWERFQEFLEPLRARLNAAVGESREEWDIPREASDGWSAEATSAHAEWWEHRIARQQEIDASIAAKAEFEYLYDKPYEDNKKVRVAGPFTVESLSPHRVLTVGVDDELIDGLAETSGAYGEPQDFATMILENLRTAGVQQAQKEDKITFSSLAPWPGEYVCAEGRYFETDPDRDDTDESIRGIEKRAAIFIGPEFGTVSRPDLVAAAREAGDAGFDVLIACAFNYDAHSSEFTKLGRIPVLKAHMNADLHMGSDLKKTSSANLFVIFGEPDIGILDAADGQVQVKVNGVDVFHPDTGEVRSDGAEGIACWFIDTDYNEESFFVRHAYFLGANDPYKALKTTLKAEINEEAWETLHSDLSRPFPKPESGRIAVKVINHLGDEVMKVFRVE